MVWFVLALALASGDPAAPAVSEAPAAPAPAAADDDGRIVCVMEKQMGSHFKKKTCLTRAQWKARRERDSAAAQRALTPETSDMAPQ
jgi:predicted secreted protein